MADWPSSLPALPVPLSHEPQSGLIRTQMDAGPDKVRRRSSAVPENYSFTRRMTGTQYATLRTFYNSTLGGGALAFNLDDPVTDTEESFRFLQPPAGRIVVGASGPNDRIYDVQINIEKLP